MYIFYSMISVALQLEAVYQSFVLETIHVYGMSNIMPKSHDHRISVYTNDFKVPMSNDRFAVPVQDCNICNMGGTVKTVITDISLYNNSIPFQLSL